MSGQRKNYSEYEKQITEHVRKYPPYGPYEPLDIDLRALSRYCKENNISNVEVTKEVVEKFKIIGKHDNSE